MKDQHGVLATDLDGTFIPLDGNSENISDLKLIQQLLHEQNISLCFVTGRHFESTQSAMKEFHLPEADWIICDVGTTIRRNSGGAYEIVEEYQKHLEQLIADCSIEQLRDSLSRIKKIRPQEDEKQGEFKLSFYVEQTHLDESVSQIETILSAINAPYSIIHSVDPFNGDGLIDLLPKSVSKAYALDWWAQSINFQRESIIFAGDSGNDLAAMTAGYRTIVVGNADQSVVDSVKKEHARRSWSGRYFHASRSATSGVLEGLSHFGFSASS